IDNSFAKAKVSKSNLCSFDLNISSNDVSVNSLLRIPTPIAVFPSSNNSTACPPNREASTLSAPLGLPPRWIWPSTDTRASTLMYFVNSFAQSSPDIQPSATITMECFFHVLSHYQFSLLHL